MNKKWEMEALLIDQSQLDEEQGKNKFSLFRKSGKERLEGMEKTVEERGRE